MILFPTGKRFAFSVLDDTDDSTLKNVEPVYAMLRSYGLRTTKTTEVGFLRTPSATRYLRRVSSVLGWGKIRLDP